MQTTVTTAAPVAPAPVVTFVPVINAPKIYERYLGRQSVGLGVTSVVIGVLCCIFNGVAVAYSNYSVAVVGHGFWCGVLFIITGAFGIGAGLRKRLCQIVAFMVLNILSASFTIALLTVGIIGAATERRCADYSYYYGYNYDCDYTGNYYYPCYNRPCREMPYYKVVVSMESLLAILGFVEAVVAIWGAALCCKSGVCCCTKSDAQVQVVPPGYMPYNGQVIFITQTQGGQYTYPPQPIMPYPQGLIAPPAYASSYTQPGWTGQQPMAASVASEPNQRPPEYVAPSATSAPVNKMPADEKY